MAQPGLLLLRTLTGQRPKFVLVEALFDHLGRYIKAIPQPVSNIGTCHVTSLLDREADVPCRPDGPSIPIAKGFSRYQYQTGKGVRLPLQPASILLVHLKLELLPVLDPTESVCLVDAPVKNRMGQLVGQSEPVAPWTTLVTN
jgi:hypothetical protein